MASADDPYFNPYDAPKTEMNEGGRFDPTAQFSGYGGFWARFAAIFIDGLILGAVNFAIGFVVGMIGFAAMGPNALQTPAPGQPPDMSKMGPLLALQGIQLVISLVIHFAYYVGMNTSSYQGTVGKIAMGLKVTDLNYQRITVGRAFGRELGKVLSYLICMIGYIMAAFDDRKRSLHDRIAGTYVMKTR